MDLALHILRFDLPVLPNIYRSFRTRREETLNIRFTEFNQGRDTREGILFQDHYPQMLMSQSENPKFILTKRHQTLNSLFQ